MPEKTEWPNEAKLKGLREEGIVALSPFSCRCVWSLAFLFTLWLLRSRLGELGSEVQAIYKPGALSLVDLTPILGSAARILAVPLLAAFFVTLLWGLFQTRFFFRFSLLALNFQRLGRVHFPNPLSAAARILAAIFEALVFLAAGLLCARLCWTGVLYLLNNDRLYAGSWFPAVMQAALAPICILLGIMALLGWLVSKFLFMLRHRMSREEMERGVVETEVHSV